MSRHASLFTTSLATLASWLSGCAHTNQVPINGSSTAAVQVVKQQESSRSAPAVVVTEPRKKAEEPAPPITTVAATPPTTPPFVVPESFAEPPGPTLPQVPTPPPTPVPTKPILEVAEDPALIAALRSYLKRQPAEALAQLGRLDQRKQEDLLMLLPLIVKLSEKNLNELTPQEAQQDAAQLQQFLQKLRQQAELLIPRMCFCTRIEKFGTYEPLPDNHVFRPGEPVLVYVELQNVSCLSEVRQVELPNTSSIGEERRFVTRLTSALQIKAYNGDVVWNHDLADRVQTDVSLSPRWDFFSTLTFGVPDNLKPGSYTLRVQIKDVPTGRVITRTLDFRVSSVQAKAS